MIEIIETKDAKEIKILSEKLLKNLYKDNILEQKLQENPCNEFFLSHYFLSENNEILAYLALYHNENLKFENKKTFTFGNYEAIENTEIAQILINHAINETKNKNGEYLIANMQGSTWNNYRFSLNNDFPNFFLEPYHPIYYNQHFINTGFEVIQRYFSSIDQAMQYDNVVILEQEKAFLVMGVRIRNIDLDNFASELQQIFRFSLQNFAQNFLYTPIQEYVFVEKYLPLKPFLRPDLILIAEDNKGNIIGVFFAVPDVFDQTQKTLIIKSIVRHEGQEWKGLGHVIGNVLYRNAKKNGFTQVIHAFMRENGFSTQISKNYSGKIYKNYALYGKSI